MGNSGSDNNNETLSKQNLPFYNREDEYEELSEKTGIKCSLKNRLIGFGVCCAIGWLISILSTLTLLIHHSQSRFAILYSIGQVISITGYPSP